MKELMIKKFVAIFFITNFAIGGLSAHVLMPLEFFNLKEAVLPGYQPGVLLEPITVCISKKERTDRFYQSIFILKLVWQLKIKIQANYDLIFDQLFNFMTEELLKKLITFQQITEEEFGQNALCLEAIYRSCILEKAICELDKLSTCSIDLIFEFQRTIESYFQQQDCGTVINFQFFRPEHHPIVSLFFTDIFSHPSHPAGSKFRPTELTKAEFSMIFKNTLIKRIKYLQMAFNPSHNFQNAEQFFLLKRVLSY